MSTKVTKVIVLGEAKPQKRLKPIEFRSLLNCVEVNRSDEAIVKTSEDKPSYYKYIELICCNYQAGLDLMFAYNDPEDRGTTGVLYIGKFNDGVVL